LELTIEDAHRKSLVAEATYVWFQRDEQTVMKDIVVHSLREGEKRRFFEFARSLPDRDFWGKKGRSLRGGFQAFQGFFQYIEPFQPKCFLVAEEENKLVGFIVAVYNAEWINELTERYGYDMDKRAYILGIACVQRRIDVLEALADELTSYFSRSGVKSVEYPTLGNVCLTTGTNVLTADNVDALMMFRGAGFRISECYYSMKLELERCMCNGEHPLEEGRLRFRERGIEIVREDEVLGNISWDPVVHGKTSLGISVARACRGRRLGTALMAEALRRLKTEGVKVVDLGVDGNNLPALRLYRRFGFEAYATHFYVIKPCIR
jgi:RimJ/RimL family protein N-acetyltransferase